MPRPFTVGGNNDINILPLQQNQIVANISNCAYLILHLLRAENRANRYTRCKYNTLY